MKWSTIFCQTETGACRRRWKLLLPGKVRWLVGKTWKFEANSVSVCWRISWDRSLTSFLILMAFNSRTCLLALAESFLGDAAFFGDHFFADLEWKGAVVGALRLAGADRVGVAGAGVEVGWTTGKGSDAASDGCGDGDAEGEHTGSLGMIVHDVDLDLVKSGMGAPSMPALSAPANLKAPRTAPVHCKSAKKSRSLKKAASPRKLSAQAKRQVRESNAIKIKKEVRERSQKSSSRQKRKWASNFQFFPPATLPYLARVISNASDKHQSLFDKINDHLIRNLLLERDHCWGLSLLVEQAIGKTSLAITFSIKAVISYFLLMLGSQRHLSRMTKISFLFNCLVRFASKLVTAKQLLHVSPRLTTRPHLQLMWQCWSTPDEATSDKKSLQASCWIASSVDPSPHQGRTFE